MDQRKLYGLILGESMNYLVIGSARFIGSACAAFLIPGGATCTTIDNLSTGNIERIPQGCKFIRGDVSDPCVIAQLNGEKFDAKCFSLCYCL